MWNKLSYTDSVTAQTTDIRYLTGNDNTHWVVLKDLLTALRYAKSSITSGSHVIARSIPKPNKRTEYTNFMENSTDKPKSTILLDCGGCYWLLTHTKQENPSRLESWLEENIFNEEEIHKAKKELGALEAIPPIDGRFKENQIDNCNCGKFNRHLVRIVPSEESYYLYLTDIAEVLGHSNLRTLSASHVASQYRKTIYQGCRPATLLAIDGILQLFNYIIKEKELAKQFINWLTDSAIPSIKEGKDIPEYITPDMLLREKESPSSNKDEDRNPPVAVPKAEVSFEDPVIQLKTYPYKGEIILQVLLVGDTAYFLIKSFAKILNISSEDIGRIVPNIWKSFQAITESYNHTDDKGVEHKGVSKYITACLLDNGVYTLLEQTNRTDVRDWMTNIVVPNLLCAGYVPSNPYDLDMTGVNDNELVANDITDPVIFITAKGDEGRFECLYNDIEIPVVCNKTGIWFALGSVEHILEYPPYIIKSYPLKGVDFRVVTADQVQRIAYKNGSTKTKWQPYYIEYEGLKSLLAVCDKPNAEAFYLSLEDVIIPSIRKAQEDQKKGNETMSTGKDTTVDTVIEESSPSEEAKLNFDVDKLLNDPDTFIRILKAYKTTKETKADLTAENAALREYIKANKSKIDFAEALAHNMDSEEADKFIRKLAESIVEGGSQKLKEWLSQVTNHSK